MQLARPIRGEVILFLLVHLDLYLMGVVTNLSDPNRKVAASIPLIQCWASYLLKVTSYILLATELFSHSYILPIK